MPSPSPAQLFEAMRDAAASPGSRFSGVIRVDADGTLVGEAAFGLADRAYGVANTPSTRFAVASVTKGFTALAIAALIEDGLLDWDTPVRPILGDDLPLIDAAVTIDHLLTHRSGIGDYLAEDEIDVREYPMPIPVHRLDSLEALIPALDGHPQVSAPGTEFVYNNSGFAVLGLVAERVSGKPYAELVAERVFAPAGMTASDHPRFDELGGDVARGYLHASGLRTNVLHLPVLEQADGGTVTTAADLAAFWTALFDGRIVRPETLATLIEPVTTGDDTYGRGFWIGEESGMVMLLGWDAGQSARTWYDPATKVAATVIANWTDGAWPILDAADGEDEEHDDAEDDDGDAVARDNDKTGTDGEDEGNA